MCLKMCVIIDFCVYDVLGLCDLMFVYTVCI